MKLPEILFFGAFLLFIIFILMFDLGIFKKKKDHGHKVSTKEALIWTCIWISFALSLYVFLFISGNILHGIENNTQLIEIASKYEHPINLSSTDFQTNISIQS